MQWRTVWRPQRIVRLIVCLPIQASFFKLTEPLYLCNWIDRISRKVLGFHFVCRIPRKQRTGNRAIQESKAYLGSNVGYYISLAVFIFVSDLCGQMILNSCSVWIVSPKQANTKVSKLEFSTSTIWGFHSSFSWFSRKVLNSVSI